MRPRDAQKLLDVIGEFAPNSNVHPGKRDLSGEIWSALVSAGDRRLASELTDVTNKMRELQWALKDEAWKEHELKIQVGKLPIPESAKAIMGITLGREPSLNGISLTDVVNDRIVHILLEENHGPRSGEVTVEIPGDRTYGGTWSIWTAGPEHGEASVLRLDIPVLSNAEVAGIAQALVEGCPSLGADTFQYP